MSVATTLSFIVGGLFLALIVVVPITFIFWMIKLYKIKKKIVKYFYDTMEKEKANLTVSELNSFIDEC